MQLTFEEKKMEAAKQTLNCYLKQKVTKNKKK